jgi:hypothetical protein
MKTEDKFEENRNAPDVKKEREWILLKMKPFLLITTTHW